MSKTPAYENLRRAARCYRRQADLRDYHNGIKIFHHYENLSEQRISWWDDVNFLYSDYLLALRWLHPRQAFQDELNQRIEQRLATQFATVQASSLDFKACYRQQGRSRKKVLAWESSIGCDELSWQEWRRLRQAAERDILQQQLIQIKPSYRSRWRSHARQLDLCTPVEILSATDLITLVEFSRGLLRGAYQLTDQFATYCYQNSDWLAEHELREQSKTQFHEWKF